MVVGWHRPTRLHIDTQAITEMSKRNVNVCQKEPLYLRL